MTSSNSDESHPSFGCLLEAYDDELGLLLSCSVSSKEVKNEEVNELVESSKINLWEFENHI